VPTSGPSQESQTKTSSTGVAAHICAASQGKGARRRLDLSKFDRSKLSDYSNGIWMCATHAKLIDTDELRFTSTMLARWRELAELRATLSHEVGRPVEVHLRNGNEVPLAVVQKSVADGSSDVVNSVCDAVLDSCIVDVWGKQIGYAVRDVVGELLANAFLHGGATEFRLDIDLNFVRIRSNDGPYSFGQLVADERRRGGQQAAAALTKLNGQLITSYRREGEHNVLEIAFITSADQVLRTTACSIDYGDFATTLELRDELPAMYTSCETIYIVLGERQHLVPSAARHLSDRLKQLASTGKRIVVVGSHISEGVVHTLESAFPHLQVMEI
jgi:hypothetical protein